MLNSNYSWRNRTFRYWVTLGIGFVVVCAFYQIYLHRADEGIPRDVIVEVFISSAMIGVVFWWMIRRSQATEQANIRTLEESEAKYRNLVEATGMG